MPTTSKYFLHCKKKKKSGLKTGVTVSCLRHGGRVWTSIMFLFLAVETCGTARQRPAARPPRFWDHSGWKPESSFTCLILAREDEKCFHWTVVTVIFRHFSRLWICRKQEQGLQHTFKNIFILSQICFCIFYPVLTKLRRNGPDVWTHLFWF